MSLPQAVAPPVSFGGPTSAAWREDTLTRAEELDGLQGWVRARNGADAASLGIAESIRRHLDAARETAAGLDGRPWRARLAAAVRGSSVERSLGNLDAVETDLLRLAPLDYVRGQMPSLQAHVCRFLPKDDPRRLRLAAIARDAPHKEITEIERDNVIAAFHAASSQRRRELIRLRSFRNVIVAATVLMLIVAVGLGVLGSARPDAIPLCFEPERGRQVCPTGSDPTPTDVWLIQIVGLVAAGVAGAFSLRNIRGTSTPYSLPVALAALKLPTGAVTAVLGLLLMRGEFVPGLTALDNSAQIVSWAIVFGYSQQLFTRMVDEQASAVLQDVGGRGAAGDRPMSAD
jgi:hypothetical protein